MKHALQQSFVFLHCSLLLRDVPCWMESVLESMQQQVARSSPTPASKRKAVPVEADTHDEGGFGAIANLADNLSAHLPSYCTTAAISPRFKHSKGQKIEKEEQRWIREKNCAMRAHAKDTTHIAATNMA